MLRAVGWILIALATLCAVAALADLYALGQWMVTRPVALRDESWLDQLAGPGLSILCAILLAILARRFLVRARRRASRADIEQMTDRFS